MKILVTGGAGFIGSHLVDRLIKKGNQVSVIDNLSTGKKENLNPRAEFFLENIRSRSIQTIFSKRNFDLVYHLAAQVVISKATKNPIKDAKDNILGTLNILDVSARYKVKKMFYANSVTCFGEPDDLPINENHPIQPLSFYALSKYTASIYTNLYSNYYNLPSIINIFANVYGPRQSPFGEGGVIAIFSYKMLKGQPIEIFGNGEQTRDFIFVDDLVDAITLSTNLKNETFTIGTEIETSINTLFKEIAALTNYPKKPIYRPKREGDVLKSVLSIKKAQKMLKFKPNTSLEKGLLKTFQYFKDNFKD
jgi:UDP-glucose 4-epimerase